MSSKNNDGVEEFRPRTLAQPFVTDNPPVSPILSFEAAKDSCVIASKLFSVETKDNVVDEYVLPVDDVIDSNTYVGDWEELYIRTYHRVFSEREHVFYWGKSEIGNMITCVGRAVEDLGHPALSLGAHGFHFARLAKADNYGDFPPPKHVAKLFPHLEDVKYSYAKDAEKLSMELLSFEQKMKPTRSKHGILYVRDGQVEENDMYGNLDPSPQFVDFLKRIGQIIELKSHKGFRGGLDCSGANNTGELSLYTTMFLADGRFIPAGVEAPADSQETVSLEVMFHVAPFLPYSSVDGNQQLHKKRHLGNDICVVIFKDGTSKFDPDVFKSQFNHVYVIVTPCSKDGKGKETHYKVEVVHKGLKGFLPQLPENNIIAADKIADWLLLKLINGEVAAMNAKDLRLKMKRTRIQTLDSWSKTHIADAKDSQTAFVNRRSK